MQKIKIGNLDHEIREQPEKRGWFMGHFIDGSSLLHSSDIEMKWSICEAGEDFPEIRGCRTAKSLAILIEGEFEFTFPDTKEKYTLSKPGDFIFWDQGVYHSTKSLKKSKLLTVRWPSLPGNKTTKTLPYKIKQ
jgi:hypothetical protein